MKINYFEDIQAWQKAEKLVLILYKIFKSNKDFSFRDQILRAALSTMNNIAEGFERQGNKEFRNFLYIAKGSCAEVRSMLYVARKLGYITEQEYKEICDQSLEISRMLSGLIKTL